MHGNTPIVETHQLTRKFGNFVAVEGITFSVKPGEIVGFLGANGAGKTTLIRMLCGLLVPTSGTARVAGYDVAHNPEEVKYRIGYMSQKFSLYEDLTVEENIELFAGLYRLKAQQVTRKKEWLFQQYLLRDFARTLTRDLPLGLKQRLALGTALLHEPPVIFLDEPTSGVDPRFRRAFWDNIHALAREGKTIFVTTHFMEEAEYCHRILVMHAGKAIALDSPETLKRRYQKSTMQELFIHLVEQQLQEVS